MKGTLLLIGAGVAAWLVMFALDRLIKRNGHDHILDSYESDDP